ncbi:MAG: bifunctional salicylyl-CoA 5-hydroxylase/oxidoreductase [Acidimicrobiia bacterium]|nr:bifunctional salicylyl-CoA 5-hydroxylase/oxidoreductase [Acidimicrobiia bacterium]
MIRAVRIACVGGGPGGLFFALLMKRARPDWDVVVHERSEAGDTSGLGVVLSDAALAWIRDADTEVHADIAGRLRRWDTIDVHHPTGAIVSSTGHGYGGISRRALTGVLTRRASGRGVEIRHGSPIASIDELDADLVVGADGAGSAVRASLGAAVRVVRDVRPNRFLWLQSTRPCPAFTFLFRRTDPGLWIAHAYEFEPGRSAVIAECSEACWHAAGLEDASDGDAERCVRQVFGPEMNGHDLAGTRSGWQRFETLRVEPWWSSRAVLLGDAAHTAHFSIGAGTRLAMEDAAALVEALSSDVSMPEALAAYDARRRPAVESAQRAAQASVEWFEHADRYEPLDPVRFAFSLLTRSLRLTHEDLRLRDPGLVARVDALVAADAATSTAGAVSLAGAGFSLSLAGATSSWPIPRDAGTTVPPPMFTPFRLRDLVIPNRVVVSPMCQYSAEDGTVGDWHLVHLGSRAIGGAGLVIAEMTDVSREGRISPGCAGLYTDEHASAWRRIVEFVHRDTPAKIGVQLGHAGRKGSTHVPWEGANEPLEEGGWPLVAASPMPYFPDRSPAPRALSRAGMDGVIADYERATRLADAAGFDLIEIHMAHGYLLASFISPLTNQRADEFGGALAGRMRFPLEVFDACRRLWPARKPMSVRISAADWASGGTTGEDAVAIARLLKAHGCDIVDVSSGQTVPDQQPAYGRLYQTPFAERIRIEAGIPTMTVGAISSWADVNTIVAAGRADLCLLARGHLFDPYWTRHAAAEQGYDLPWPDPYRAAATFRPRSRRAGTSMEPTRS